MYFMVGAGNFLLFFLGMELAPVPMACLVAVSYIHLDVYKRQLHRYGGPDGLFLWVPRP